MPGTEQMDPQVLQIQRLLDQFLITRKTAGQRAEAKGPHLDEDTLAAFSEGRLRTRETGPVVSHLVDCSFCRGVTTELIRLDVAFAESESAAPAAAPAEPMRISEVLSNLFSKIFGTSDGAVFAHQEDKKEETDSEEKEKNEE